ncbi:MAG: acyl-CoA thioesterase [Pseudomonadota bacterium]
MGRFVDATAVTRHGDGFRAELDPDWFIWGPFGGYLAALSLRAMCAASALTRPAAFSCQYLNAGVAGAVDIHVEVRRPGKRAGLLRASIVQNEKVLLDAQAWLTADGLSGLAHDDAMIPPIARPDELESWNGYADNEESLSAIWSHIERKPAPEFRSLGQAPGVPQWRSWVRLAEDMPDDDPALLAARALLWMDMGPWNTALVAYAPPTMYLAPTLDLTVQFQPHLCRPDTGSRWQLIDVASPSVGEGLFGANGRLWSESGKLVAIGSAQALCVPNPRYKPASRQ